MATFESSKEILACYAALEKREKGCVKRTQTLLEYLDMQEKSNWIPTVRRLKRDMQAAKRALPKKDW